MKDSIMTGLDHYQRRDYISALKHFSSGSNSKSYDIQSLTALTLTAVTNLQLCNYNEAAEQLKQVYSIISDHESQGSLSSQFILLKAKVLSNLLILELVSCGQRVQQILAELLEVIEQTINEDKRTGHALFKIVVRSIMGFDSLKNMEQQCLELLETAAKSEQKSKVNHASESSQPVMLSACSLYCHLAGDLKTAYILEQTAFKSSKNNQTIPALLSLRHLEELSKELQDQRASKQYRNDLTLLMSGEQLQGVAEETLFRNYRKKIQLASLVVTELISREQQWGIRSEQDSFERWAVSCKLKRLQKIQKNLQIDTVLKVLEENGDILNFIGKSEFVKSAADEYKSAFLQLAEVMSIFQERMGFQAIANAVRGESSYSTFRLNPSLGQEKKIVEDASNQDLSFHSSRSRSKKRQPYATSLYRQKPEHFKPTNNSFVQEEQQSQQIAESKLSIHHTFGNKIYLRSQHQQVSQPNSIYKIAKEQQSVNPHRKVQGKGKSKTEQQSILKTIKSDLRQQEQEPKQVNVIDQFLKKQVTESSSNVQSLNKIKGEKGQHQILKKSAAESGSNVQPLSKIKEEKEQQAAFNIIKSVSEEEIPLLNVKSRAKLVKTERQHHQLQQSQSSNIPISKSALPSQKPPAESSNIATLSELKIKHSESIMQRSYISKEQLTSKLRRMISLCQSGQYIEKRHFSSDGGAQRFLMLAKNRDKIFWGESQQSIDISSNSSSYSIQDVRGIVYGKVTETMRKECNYKLDPWKCFSLVLKKRTFDVYLPEERDLFFWLPGLSLCLRDLNYDHVNYHAVAPGHPKKQKVAANVVLFGDRKVQRFYSVGRILWKKFLMRLKVQHLSFKKSEKYHKFSCPNAYVIVVAAVRVMGYKPKHMKKQVC